MTVVGVVDQLWRHPVKSLGGERVDALTVGPDGVDRDRTFGVRDVTAGVVLSAKRSAALLEARARLDGDDVVVELPDGRSGRAGEPTLDADLSDWLGRAVAVVAARPGERVGYDAGFTGPPGRFVDGWPLHLVTSATLESDDPRRYRANVVVGADGEPFLEDAWVGATLTIGGARLAVAEPCGRCVMVTRAQPGLPEDRSRLLRLADRGVRLGVNAVVERPGLLRVGDAVRRTG